jgi:hypothetical protein
MGHDESDYGAPMAHATLPVDEQKAELTNDVKTTRTIRNGAFYLIKFTYGLRGWQQFQ